MSVVKRKRAVSDDAAGLQASKQKKLDDIKSKSEEALSKKTGLANITHLLKYLEDDGIALDVIFAAISALTQVFAKLIDRGDANVPESSTEKVQIELASWIRSQLTAFVEHLSGYLFHDEPSINVLAFDSLVELVKHESEYLSMRQKQHAFENKMFLSVTRTLIGKKISLTLQERVLEVLNEFDDLRMYFSRNVKKVAALSLEQPEVKVDTEQLLNFLSGLRQVQDSDDLSGDLLVANEHEFSAKCNARKLNFQKRAFSEAWLEFLRLPLESALLKKIMLSLHRRVIPYLSDPTLLIDFLIDAYDAGGSLSLLALNSLFNLIVEHNLDYPDFYKKLYILLDENILHIYSDLPCCGIPEEDCKTIVDGPLGGAIVVLPFIYNTLKRHPACITMIHRPDGTFENDPFKPDESDPAKAEALDSSLWELSALFRHYHPSVSGLRTLFEKPLSQPFFDLEDFLDQTYASMYEADAEKLYALKPTFASTVREMTF
ncbi:hypothetical protein BC829DRAFT_439045 [Chytridium lagenaria]|nr:hypothetical protein BC829DRAFT_439045 [Chytridium lagenaria]